MYLKGHPISNWTNLTGADLSWADFRGTDRLSSINCDAIFQLLSPRDI
ncbi:MAG: pentapeptide repeat-containing protein [Scytonema hyalinum WJT4-NPBG1]|nr:pentapeptide repeat-containing protein [Scytonema hyalinum WJT4-NPBG1]